MAIIFDNTYRGYAVNCDENKGCDTQILDKYLDHLEDMTEKHNKVLQIRFDMKYPSGISENELPNDHLSKFVSRLAQDINRNYKLPEEGRKRSSGKNCEKHSPDPRILLVREQHNESHNPHVHGVLLVNGSAFQYAPGMMKRVDRQYANVLSVENVSGLVHYCNKNGPGAYMLSRNSSDFESKKQEAVYQASYLSKTRGKENRAKHSRRVLGTKIEKK